MKTIEIPETEKRTRALTIRITESEYQAIHEYCKSKKVKKTDLVRFLFEKQLPTLL